MPHPPFVSSTSGLDYELIDIGRGRKLERFGNHILNRPEVEAKSEPSNTDLWSDNIRFSESKNQKGSWSEKVEPWMINYQSESITLKFKLEQSAFKHLGIFPEQAYNWQKIERFFQANPGKRFLNLFAYTSAASLIASAAGAEVVSVEALKQLTDWSKENAAINKISNIRWITEDARAFVKRALRRKESYDFILLDPPAFGHGTKGKRWIIEKHLESLMVDLGNLLGDHNSKLIINTYSPKMPIEKLKEILNLSMGKNSSIDFAQLGLESRFKSRLPLGNLATISRA